MNYVLCINNRYYKTKVDNSEFLAYLKSQTEEEFGDECINEKQLLRAYVKVTSQLYEKERKMQQLIEKLEVNLSKSSV